MCHTYNVIFRKILTLFLAQNLKIKIFTAQNFFFRISAVKQVFPNFNTDTKTDTDTEADTETEIETANDFFLLFCQLP